MPWRISARRAARSARAELALAEGVRELRGGAQARRTPPRR